MHAYACILKNKHCKIAFTVKVKDYIGIWWLTGIHKYGKYMSYYMSTRYKIEIHLKKLLVFGEGRGNSCPHPCRKPIGFGNAVERAEQRLCVLCPEITRRGCSRKSFTAHTVHWNTTSALLRAPKRGKQQDAVAVSSELFDIGVQRKLCLQNIV